MATTTVPVLKDTASSSGNDQLPGSLPSSYLLPIGVILSAERNLPADKHAHALYLAAGLMREAVVLRRVLILCILLIPALNASQSQTAQTASTDTKVNTESHARKAAVQRRSARSKSTQPTVHMEILEIRAEMQRQHAEMQRQIEDLKQQLTDSRQQMTQAQQTAAAAIATADKTEQASRQALSASNQAVTSLQGAVSDLKGGTTSLATMVQQNQATTKAAIESPAVLHYKGVNLTPGGFLAAESVWRSRKLQADIASPFNSIPVDGAALAQLTEFRLSAHSTRMSLLADTRAGSTSIAGYLEFDLLGAGLTSNSTESNSYLPRMRHAWIQTTWKSGWSVGAGQMWTLANSNRKGINSSASNVYLPDMIDAQYVVGLNWLRQPALRVVRNFGGRVWIAAAAEGTQTTFSVRNAPANYLFASPGTTNLTSTVNYSFDKAPDILAKIVFESGYGHYEAKGLARFFRDRVYPAAPASAAGAYNNNHLAGGVGVAASWNIARKIDVSLNSLLGNGVGRYGTSQLPDTTIRPDGTLAPIHGGQGLGTLEFNRPRFKAYAYGGVEYAGRRALLSAKGLGVGYGSPLNDNTGCDIEAAPTTSTTPTSGKCNADTRSIYQGVVGFWYRPYVGAMGRVQYGLQYSYTERNAWSGVGGAPTGDENMVFTSMRYYLP